jgi:hypothetical protein
MGTARYRGSSSEKLEPLALFLLLERDNSDGLDRGDIEEWWSHDGEQITADWIEKHPGTRPWPFWVFDVDEERPIINPDRDPGIDRAMRRDTFFGVLHTGIMTAIRTPEGLVSVPWQEPEAHYLASHGLLADAERAILNL